MLKTIFNDVQYKDIIRWATTPYQNGLTYKSKDLINPNNIRAKELRSNAQKMKINGAII